MLMIMSILLTVGGGGAGIRPTREFSKTAEVSFLGGVDGYQDFRDQYTKQPTNQTQLWGQKC